ncbi:MAG: hypothetical protein SVY10_19230 [Thermodesulfobacteriota bacterium]|nr:hypothetical protein [Thermodesulfobacteriota bacterium]
MDETLRAFYMMPLDYLVTFCFLVISIGAAVLGYRAVLRKWISSGSHPSSLRILMYVLGGGVFLLCISYWFWEFLPSVWHWKLEKSLGPLIVYIIFSIWSLVLLCLILSRKKTFE